MRNVIAFLAVAVLCVAAMPGLWSAAPARAQHYPFEDTLDELQEQAERLARRQAQEDERRRQLAELAEENRERWERFQRQLVQKQREIMQEARRREANDLRQALVRHQKLYEVALMLFAQGDMRSAETAIGNAARRMHDEPVVREGWLDVLQRRVELIARFYGDSWTSSRATRLERQVERYDSELTGLLDTVSGSDRRERERRHEEFRAWLSELPGYIDQREELLKAIEHDTFNGERIWQLSRLLADNLYQLADARAWLEILIEHCPNHFIVRSGLARAGLARLMARQGWLDRSAAMVRPLGNQCQAFFDGIPQEAAPIRERARQAQEEGQAANLTPMERWLMEMSSDGRRREAMRRAVANQIRAFEEDIGETAATFRAALGE